MSLTGILTVYQNNGLFDYERLAHFTAERAGRLWNLPFVSLPTHSQEGYKRTFPGEEGEHPFLNNAQIDAMACSPFDVTIFIDADFVPVTRWLPLMAKTINSIKPLMFLSTQNVLRENLIDELRSLQVNPFPIWSTVLIYQMDYDPESLTQRFFNGVRNVRDNWEFYAKQVGVSETLYRNDFAFAIAAHRLRVPLHYLPSEYKCLFTFDTPCEAITDTSFIMEGKAVPYDTHCMNKRSLLNLIGDS